MKKVFSILSFFFALMVSVTVLFAQNEPLSTRTSPDPMAPSECADGIDNDVDGKIDKAGATFGGKTYTPDPDCLVSGATSEGKAAGLPINVVINNPLKVDTIQEAIKLFMDAVLRIALPFIVIFFIWSGFSFVLARGNPDKIKVAKNMFLYTVIGTLLILGAWVITNAIIGTVNSITG